MSRQEWSRSIALCRSPIERFTADNSAYRRQVATVTKNGVNGSVTAEMVGLLDALVADFAKGRLATFEELIHADMAGDYLQQADALLRSGYKDPALVLAGSVLEQHLRSLATKNGVSVFSGGHPKKADTLNADLAKLPSTERQRRRT